MVVADSWRQLPDDPVLVGRSGVEYQFTGKLNSVDVKYVK